MAPPKLAGQPPTPIVSGNWPPTHRSAWCGEHQSSLDLTSIDLAELGKMEGSA